MLVVEFGGPTILARIGIMPALNLHVGRVQPRPRSYPLGTPQAGPRPLTLSSEDATKLAPRDAYHTRHYGKPSPILNPAAAFSCRSDPSRWA